MAGYREQVTGESASSTRRLTCPRLVRPCPLPPAPRPLFRSHVREQDDIADRVLIGKNHPQPIYPDAFSRGWRHPIRKRSNVVLVDHHRFIVSVLAQAHLRFESSTLVGRIIDL